MDRYIAAKPVRFDRDYAVGETIPGGVIDRRNVKRLVEMGRIRVAAEQDDGSELIPCPVCGKLVKTKLALASHIKRMHPE